MEYGKNLTEIVKIRISKSDLEFYKKFAADHNICLSETIRHILDDYRKYCENITVNYYDMYNKGGSSNVAPTNKRH